MLIKKLQTLNLAESFQGVHRHIIQRPGACLSGTGTTPKEHSKFSKAFLLASLPHEDSCKMLNYVISEEPAIRSQDTPFWDTLSCRPQLPWSDISSIATWTIGRILFLCPSLYYTATHSKLHKHFKFYSILCLWKFNYVSSFACFVLGKQQIWSLV